MVLHDLYVYLDCMNNCSGRSCEDCQMKHGYDECPTHILGREEGFQDIVNALCSKLLEKEYQGTNEVTVDEIADILAGLCQ